jgi:hypothetical protein
MLKSLLLLQMALALQPARAGLLTVLAIDNSVSVVTASSRFEVYPTAFGGFLYGPTGAAYSKIDRFSNLFSAPGNDFETDTILLEANLTPIHAVTEVNVSPILFGDLAPYGCSQLSFCTPTENGVVYPVADIYYTDGSVDNIAFEWVVTPEPASVLLVGTALAGVLLARVLRRFRVRVGLPPRSVTA